MAQDKKPGNFASDREKASEAGRKGGQQSHGQQAQSGSGSKSQQGSGASGGKMPDMSHKTGQK